MRGKLFTMVFLIAAGGPLAPRPASAQLTPSSSPPPESTMTASPVPTPSATSAMTPTPTAARPALNLPSAKVAVDRERAMDATFMTRTVERGLELAELGRIAADRASDPQVRALGQQILQDRGRANEQLRLLAQREALGLPAAVPAGRRSELDRISRLSPPALDRVIVLSMLRLYDADVADFQKQIGAGQEVELQGWVYDTLPNLENQQEEIHRIAGELGIPASAAQPAPRP